MPFVECENGHFFDPAKDGRCPFCSAAELRNTAEVSTAGSPQTQPPVPVEGQLSDSGTQFLPPVGWLVVTDGPMRGVDFTIRPGRNAIGRSPDMAVPLSSDPSVAQDEHAVVVYDSRSNRFVFRPGAASGKSYLNGYVVDSTRPLQQGDKLQIGGTSLVFVALASDRFRWS
jgi:hypothetical protein